MKNYYKHQIDLESLDIKNTSKEQFINLLENIPYRGYKVEDIQDGRKIIITKPGGKSAYGRPKKEDFLVFIYNSEEESLWQITHKQILEDLESKANEDKSKTIILIDLLERTYKGEEPNDFIDDIKILKFDTGELPEVLIKVYKWIWGQEDVNYPNGEGRTMSWKSITELRNTLKDA